MNTSLQEINSFIQTAVQGIPLIDDALQKLLYYAEKGATCTCKGQNPDTNGQERKSYNLGQDVFYQYLQFTTAPLSDSSPGDIVVITDDGHVACLNHVNASMKIYDTDGSHVGTIPLERESWDMTVVNNSAVAVTLPDFCCIDIFDIHNEQIVKSIQLTTMCFGITTLKNTLVVGCDRRTLIIDPQTTKVENTIDTGDYSPTRLCCFNGDIFYTVGTQCHDLFHYSHFNKNISKVQLPSRSLSMTTLQDGSVYVICDDSSVQHVSSDGKKYKRVTTKGLRSLGSTGGINYNPEQKKLVVTGDSITVFNEY
ncbi:uncharacterized protein LOC127734667 [Mytilus californianus]|uniref:uncharacterized protein LOC127734667 n=1 Tax=Mytilus californianus TaxID=6549 RepID=UPI00224566FD|nr:uncharacterized protein LOC127734667 [Mytilus californianus]